MTLFLFYLSALVSDALVLNVAGVGAAFCGNVCDVAALGDGEHVVEGCAICAAGFSGEQFLASYMVSLSLCL